MIDKTLVVCVIGWTINAAVFQAKGQIGLSLLNAGLAVGAGWKLLDRLS